MSFDRSTSSAVQNDATQHEARIQNLYKSQYVQSK